MIQRICLMTVIKTTSALEISKSWFKRFLSEHQQKDWESLQSGKSDAHARQYPFKGDIYVVVASDVAFCAKDVRQGIDGERGMVH